MTGNSNHWFVISPIPTSGESPRHLPLGRLPDLLEMSHGERMPLDVLQRYGWDGLPKDLGIWWTLHKRDHVACCRLVSHQLGFELRLDVDADLARSAVCRTPGEVEATQQDWRERLEGKEWIRRDQDVP